MNPVKPKRLLAALLALACLLSLIPANTLAADSPQSSIKLDSITWSSGNYQSAYFERPCQIQDFHMNVGDLTISGFCGDHSKHLNNSHIGDTWSNPSEVTNSVVKTMLAYYYTHLLGEGYYNDECISKGFNYQISGDAVLQYNGWIQEVVWLWSTDQIPSDYEGQVEMVAQAYRESFDARNGTSHASIDDQIVSSNPNTFKSVTETILSNPGAWCECPVYEYTHPDSTVQPILVGYPKKVTTTPSPSDYQITVKKVDSTNPDLALAGAKFRLTSVTDPDFEPRNGTTDATGTYTFRSLPAGTYAVTETAAPSGYKIDSPGPDYISLPGNDGATVTQVYTDTPDNPPSGDIRKVDKDNPTTGLAGAVIAIEGVDNGFRGEYQTGASGALEGLDWSSLPYGSYKAYEKTAPQGYTLSNEVKTFNISAANRHVELVFSNDAKVKAQLLKVDASSRPISGAVFNILKDGQIIGTEATDASGKITVSNVTEGMYAFVEISAPAGYVRMNQPATVYVDQATIQSGGTVTVTAVNEKLPELKISKVDAKDSTPVPGTVFTVEGVDSDYKADWTMGADGTYTASVEPGAYKITEKSVPDPYVLDANNVRTVSLNAGDTRELVFRNHKNPLLKVSKIDATDSTPVPGTVFAVEGVDSDYKADWTMGADGSCSLRVSPGTYKITEKSVPDPYVLDTNNVQTVSLNAGDEKELVFQNRKKPLLIVSKVDALDGRPIPGTVFTVEGIDNSFKGDWTTGMSGAVSQRVEPGSYKVTEKSVPAPYYLPENDADQVQTIRLNAGDERELVFRDYKEPEITIYKLDSVTGAPIEGTEFHVTYTSTGASADTPATYDFGTVYTDSRGEILLHKAGIRLYPGEYTITETKAAPGFQMKEPTTQTVILSGSESKTVTFRNEPLNAIAVEKYDSVTGQAVAGATFRLRYLSGTSGTGGTIIGTKTTGTNGSAIWTGLEAGTYIVEEVSPAPGYNILQVSETVYIEANGEQTVITIPFYNAPDGSVLIRKIDSVTHAPLSDVEFLVTDSKGTYVGDANGKYVSNAGGMIQIDGVAPGTTLVIRETRTREGYILDDTAQTITVEAGKVNVVEFRNQPEPTIIILKQDAQTGKPLSGVSFSVTTAKGTVVGDGAFVTDSEGKIVLTGLDPDTYIVTETAAIPGYVLDRTPYTVTVGPAETRTLTVWNQPRARLLIQKFDRLTGQTLAGAEFKIVPANEVTEDTGLTSSTNLYRTDENGQIYLENLLPGAYIITEVNPPEGYALDEEAQTVTLRPGVTGQAWFYDSPLASLTILKRDAISRQPLANAEFIVRTSEGTLVGENNGVYVTGEDGTATITGLLPNETFIVTEDSAPAGYVMDEGPKTIKVRSGTVNSLIFNDNPTTTLLIHKYVAGTDYEPLAGVEFKVVNSKGEVVGPNNGVLYFLRNQPRLGHPRAFAPEYPNLADFRRNSGAFSPSGLPLHFRQSCR